ncbi:MAG: tetratricopeptide repeat protein [Bacteroidota bacterium]
MTKRKNKKPVDKAKASKSKTAARSKNAGKRRSTQAKPWLLALIVAALGFVLYSNTFSHEYTLDDSSVLQDNWVTQQGVAAIPTILTTHYRHGYWNASGTLYRPIPLIAFALQWQIAPDSSGFYHFVNVLAYAALGYLLFLFLARLFKGRDLRIPFIAAALFMAHPVHFEVVANIKSLDEILAFLFSLLSLNMLWNYLESKKILHLGLSIGLYFLALLSKESVVTFVAVIPLLLWFFTKQDRNQIARTSALYLLPVALIFLIRIAILGSAGAGTGSASPLDNLLTAAPDFLSQKATAFVLLGKYLWAMIFPHPLGSDFGYSQVPITTWGDWKALLSLLLHVGLAGFALYRFKSKDLLSFAILFYIITFSLFSNLVTTIGSSYGERFLFIPSLGFTLAMAILLVRYLGGGKVLKDGAKPADFFKQGGLAIGLAAIIIGLYGFRTMTRNPDWKNSFTLYEADVKVAPNSAKLRYHYGLELSKKSSSEADPAKKNQLANLALDQFNSAITLYPKYHDAYAQGGLVYYRLGQKEKAMQQYEESLKYKPNNDKVYSNMGIIYFEQQNFEKAKEVYEKAVEINPRFVDARRNLGSVYAMTKQFDKAIEQFKAGLNYANDSQKAILHFYLGSSYRDSGDQNNAQIHLNEAYRLNPQLRQ